MNEVGVERFRIDLIEDYPCSDKQALRQREGFWIREQGTLNKRIECRTQKEYQEEHKEDRKEYIKKYNEDNKQKIQEYREEHKEYYQEVKKKSAEKHKEAIIIRQREWYNINKDIQNEKRRLYRLKKKDEKQQQTTE